MRTRILFVLARIMFCLFLSGSTGFGTPNDIYCLRTFKDSVQDPLGKLTSSWSFNNSTEGSICSYVGIECWNKNESMVLNIGLTGMGLQGQFPKGLENCTSITGLDLSNNELSGSIPSDISKILPFLTYLNLSSNKFSAEIPRGLLNLSFLNALDLANNRFTGHIPASSSSSGWSRLKKLDLSLNMLSGQIPDNLSWYSLASLNLSFNNIEGEVSQVGIFTKPSSVSLMGNKKLCGGIQELGLPRCQHGTSLSIKMIIPLDSGFLCIILVLCCFFVRYQRISRGKPSFTPGPDSQHIRITYAELLKATNEFSLANLIGAGSYSSVYKGVLNNGERIVAVKVLNLQKRGVSRSFLAECKALKSIRHRNLVKILSVCSSVDFKGNDFKALVFEFMPNGSLDEWLHPQVYMQGQKKYLNFTQRLNVAIDIASALDYLHNYCRPPIVHHDLKPTNVPIDDDMNAQLCDFGLAKFIYAISNSFSRSSSTIAIKGSIGYVAPEYGMNRQASTQAGVYSYGILLLEIFVGKRPVDDMFKEGLNFHNFVKMSLPHQAMEIIDPCLFIDEQYVDGVKNGTVRSEKICRIQECLVSILKIGVACSVESPRGRMYIRDVMKELIVIRKVFLGVGIHGNR